MGTAADVAGSLRSGELTVVGRLVDSSNSALVVKSGPPRFADQSASVGTADIESVASGDSDLTDNELIAVYKPTAGEQPLWDFSRHSLGHREVASYLLSEQLGWGIVPVTVWRSEGPAGAGMCQQWIDTDDISDVIDVVATSAVPAGWHRVVEGQDESGTPVALAHSDSLELRRMAIFDVIVNNADRKMGHILRADGQLVGIDHGVTFHEEYKLRTVLWGFANTSIDEPILDDLRRLLENFELLEEKFAAHLDDTEIVATFDRLTELVDTGTFPLPSPTGPAIPWPII